MDDDQQLASLGLLANRIEGLEAQLIQMRREFTKRVGGGKIELGSVTSADEIRRWPSPEEQVVDLEPLAKWVDELQRQYAAAGDWLVPCWWQHGFAVNELTALRMAWLGVQPSDESRAALDWHQAAESCRERIRRSIGDGPGCTAVEHYSDRAVTEDLRWVEERRLLSNQRTGESE